MRRLLIFFAILMAAASSAQAQQTVAAQVVATCGTLPTVYPAGVPQPLTVDVNGLVCTNGTFTGTIGAVTQSGAFTVTPLQASVTDRSGAVTLGGTAQTLAAINATRKRIYIQNPCSTTTQGVTAESLFINFTSAAAATGGSIELGNCAVYDSGAGPVTTELISVVAATTGHKWTAKEE